MANSSPAAPAAPLPAAPSPAAPSPAAPSAAPSPTIDKKHYRNLPADEFINKVEHFSSAQVTIRVGGRDFRIPKDLLCYHSTYFDQKFNNKEIQSTRLENIPYDLRYGSPETFELVVQWMYTSNIVLPDQKTQPTVKNEGTDSEQNTNSPIPNKAGRTPRKISKATSDTTSYLRFFILAHQIGLFGPFDDIVAKVKTIVCSSDLVLSKEHIRSAATKLPRGHVIRKLFAQACVRFYMNSVSQPQLGGFRFRVEMDEFEGFAADLLYAVDEILRQRKRPDGTTVQTFPFSRGSIYTSPLSGAVFQLPTPL